MNHQPQHWTRTFAWCSIAAALCIFGAQLAIWWTR